jgi:hypothetical protein
MAIDEFIGDFEVSLEGADLKINMVNRIRGTKDGEALTLTYSLSPKNKFFFGSVPEKELPRTGVLNKKETEIAHRTQLVIGPGTSPAFIFIDVKIVDELNSIFTRRSKLVLS